MALQGRADDPFDGHARVANKAIAFPRYLKGPLMRAFLLIPGHLQGLRQRLQGPALRITADPIDRGS
jgi:hypothetical protein